MLIIDYLTIGSISVTSMFISVSLRTVPPVSSLYSPHFAPVGVLLS